VDKAYFKRLEPGFIKKLSTILKKAASTASNFMLCMKKTW